MTAQHGNGTSGGSGSRNWIIAVIVLGAILLAVFLGRQSQDIDSSVLGMEGFARVATRASAQPVRFFEGGEYLDPSKFGLRILPLYAPEPGNVRLGDRREDDDAEALRTIGRRVLESKITTIPTLLVLPKWRRGVLRQEKVHPDLLIRTTSFKPYLMYRDKPGSPEIRRGEAALGDHPVTLADTQFLPNIDLPKTVRAYALQTLSRGVYDIDCKPVLESDGLTLLAQCQSRRQGRMVRFWVLTEPDLINNMGAGEGENFAFSLKLVETLSEGRPVVLDTTSLIYTEQGNRRKTDRSFSDLARFFAYPFSIFWGALAVLVAFGLWHSWRRIGPIEDREGDSALNASKLSAIEANVTILRGNGLSLLRDRALTRSYARAQVDQLAVDLLGYGGKGRPAGPRMDHSVLLNALRQRNPDLAERLLESLQFLTGEKISGARPLLNTLNQFESQLKEVRDEFGRIAKPRR